MFKRATVTSISGTRVNVLFVSEETATGPYDRLSSYTPVIGDKVLMALVNGTYICLGKVV
jgi:hypothetical protein